MMTKRVFAVFLGVVSLASNVLAQQKVVTGNVSRTDGIPLIGVSIAVKGTTNSTFSNNNGDYSIRADGRPDAAVPASSGTCRWSGRLAPRT